MTEYAKLVVAVDATQADKATKSLSNLQSGGERVEAAVRELTDVMQRGFMLSVAATNNAASSISGLEQKTKELEKTTRNATSGMTDGFRSLIGVAATYLGASQVIQYADAYANLTNKLKLVTNSSEELASASEEIFKIAQRSRSELSATGDLYFKISQNANILGLSQKEVANVTETVAQSLALSGATAQMSGAAIMQFSQALASGVLRGDEFNSMSENAAALMDSLAKSLNVTKGELREMAADGELTADILIGALQDQADEIAIAYAKTDATIGQSFTNLKNATTVYIGQTAEATGATKLMTGAIDTLTNAISGEKSALRDSVIIVGTASAAYAAATIAINAKAIALRAATIAQTAFNAVAKANPYAIAAAGLGVLVATIYSYNKAAPEATKKTEAASTAMSRFDEVTRRAADAIQAQNRAAAGMTLPQIKEKIDAVTGAIQHLEIVQKRAAEDFARGAVSAGLVSTYDAQLKQKREQLEHLNALLGEKQKEVKAPKAAASPTAASAAAPKDNFDYGAAALNFNSIDAMAAEEEASAAAYTAARMERLNTQFMTEREAELARYTQQLDDFRFFAEQKGLAEAETNARIEEMQLVHGQNMAAISSKNSSTVLTTTLAGLQGIAGAFAGHSKTMFKVMKAASIAQGLLSIKTGIANAMALPFPANLAAAATVAAQGAGIMADIRSLTDSGGGGKGITAPSGGTSVMQPGMSGGSAIINQTAPRQQTTDIRLTGIRPDDMITGSYLMKIIEGIGETLADNGGRMGKVELVTA